MTTTPITTDIADRLEADHRQAKELLEQFEDVPPDGREEYFCHVVHDLVRHEVAEEVVVYPAVRESSPVGEAACEPRLAEQMEMEQTLADMGKLDPAGDDFSARFLSLRAGALLTHATLEEAKVFPLLRSIDAATRAELSAFYERAKEAAPTHPHPHLADSPPGDAVLGSVAALIDKTRDGARRA